MNDQDRQQPDGAYLWDGTGVPDAEVVRLEQALRVFRHAQPAPVLPARAPVAPPRRLAQGRGRWLAVAAGLIAIAGAGWFAVAMRRVSWNVSRLSGSPAVEGRSVSGQAR